MMDDPRGAVEHLKLVQDVVARMASNSAQLKTWAVSLVTATFIFSGLSNDPHWLIALGGFVPVIAFWTMDAKYLHLERCYIKFYEATIAGDSSKPFSLDYRSYAPSVGSVWKVGWSWSIVRFYGALLFAVFALMAILSCGGGVR